MTNAPLDGKFEVRSSSFLRTTIELDGDTGNLAVGGGVGTQRPPKAVLPGVDGKLSVLDQLGKVRAEMTPLGLILNDENGVGGFEVFNLPNGSTLNLARRHSLKRRCKR